MPNPIKSFGLTDRGKRRTNNEDSIFLSDEKGLYLVADGMGGQSRGEVASSMTMEIIPESFGGPAQGAMPARLAEAIKKANHKVHQLSLEKIPPVEDGGTMVAGMGTTVVALGIHEGMAAVAYVGDSRIYRLRDSKLELLTRDQSLAALAAERYSAAQVPARSAFKNMLCRAVGMDATVEVEVREEKVQPGDLFLLCSDGLTNMVPDERIQDLMSSDLSLQFICESLIGEANQNGGRDNVSCLLVRYGG